MSQQGRQDRIDAIWQWLNEETLRRIQEDLARTSALYESLTAPGREYISWDVETTRIHDSVCLTFKDPRLAVEEGL